MSGRRSTLKGIVASLMATAILIGGIGLQGMPGAAAEETTVEQIAPVDGTMATVPMGTDAFSIIGSLILKGSLTYKVMTDSTVKLVKSKDRTAVKVPSTIKSSGKTYKVVAIARSAFEGDGKLVKLIIKTRYLKGVQRGSFKGCHDLRVIVCPSMSIATSYKKRLRAAGLSRYVWVIGERSGGWKGTIASNYNPNEGTAMATNAWWTRCPVCGSHGVCWCRYGVAHKTLPLGTIIQIKHGSYIRYAVVCDRGPYVAGRDLDLQFRTARSLHVTTGSVSYRVVGKAA